MIKTHSSAITESSPSVDLTPLIDIIFIVLVFLMLTTNARLLALPVDVPDQQENALSPMTEDKTLAVNVLATPPHFALNKTTYGSWTEFKQEFINAHEAHPDFEVVVAADKAAPVQPLMRLLALLQAKNIDKTKILMEETP